jgi:hypothetical protein
MSTEDAAIQFLATLFGVVLGIPAGWAIDRLVTKRHNRKNALYILKNIKTEVGHNISSLQALKKDLELDRIALSNVELVRWNSLSIGEYQEIISPELISNICSLYADLELLSKKVQLQIDINYSALRATWESDLYNSERRIIVDSIQEEIPDLLERCKKIESDIDDEIKRLV